MNAFNVNQTDQVLIHIFGLFIQETDYTGVNGAVEEINNSFIML